MKKGQASTNKLLKVIVVAGVIGIAAVNPFFGVLASYVARDELRKRDRKKIYNNLDYLKRRGFVRAVKNIDGSYKIIPTSRGKFHLKKYEVEDIFIQVPKKWDKKWRLAIFDIPTAKQKARLALLTKLKQLGFVMLQRSVWAHPFECRKEITVLSKTFEIDEYVQQLTCDDTTAGDYLKEEFENKNSMKLT